MVANTGKVKKFFPEQVFHTKDLVGYEFSFFIAAQNGNLWWTFKGVYVCASQTEAYNRMWKPHPTPTTSTVQPIAAQLVRRKGGEDQLLHIRNGSVEQKEEKKSKRSF